MSISEWTHARPLSFNFKPVMQCQPIHIVWLKNNLRYSVIGLGSRVARWLDRARATNRLFWFCIFGSLSYAPIGAHEASYRPVDMLHYSSAASSLGKIHPTFSSIHLESCLLCWAIGSLNRDVELRVIPWILWSINSNGQPIINIREFV